jgi:hypothetical protein
MCSHLEAFVYLPLTSGSLGTNLNRLCTVSEELCFWCREGEAPAGSVGSRPVQELGQGAAIQLRRALEGEGLGTMCARCDPVERLIFEKAQKEKG